MVPITYTPLLLYKLSWSSKKQPLRNPHSMKTHLSFSHLGKGKPLLRVEFSHSYDYHGGINFIHYLEEKITLKVVKKEAFPPCKG